MKAFRFRLAQVLQLRERALQAEEGKLEALVAKRRWYETRVEELRSSVEQETQKIGRQASFSHLDLPALAQFARRTEQEQTIVKQEAAEHEKTICVQQANVVEARRALRLLEKLREKQQGAWQQGQDREAEALMSDFAAAQWSRGKG